MRSLIVVALLAAACAGESGDPGTPLCLKEVYDTCVTEHDCTSEICYPFEGGVQACTQTCNDATPCPDMFDGTAVACDPALGLCRPPAAVVCVPPERE